MASDQIHHQPGKNQPPRGSIFKSVLNGAVRATKRYLLIALAWSVVSFALPYMGDIPDSAREAMTLENVKGFLRTVIPFAIWFSYFNVSKRVKATYID